MNLRDLFSNKKKEAEKIKKEPNSCFFGAKDEMFFTNVSKIIASGAGLEKICQDAIDALAVRMDFSGAAIFLIDKADKTADAFVFSKSLRSKISRVGAPADLKRASYPLSRGDNFLMKAYLAKSEIEKKGGAAEFTPSAWPAEITRVIDRIAGSKSAMAFPVIFGSEAVAVLLAESEKEGAFSEEKKEALRIFCTIIGAAIYNAELHRSLRENIEELTRTKDNLQEVLTMKNDFLRIVSHQLRAPLTAVRGLVSMWRDGDFDHYAADKMKAVKERVGVNIDRLNNIINDIIVAMESEGELKLKYAPTDIEKLIKECIEMFKANYEKKGLYVKYNRIGGDIPEVEADRKYLIHAFMNLIDNAEKYTERGGLEITVQRKDDNIYIRFTDTGIGIDEEDQKNLFKKFSRGKKANLINPNGSGLGLYIAKQILDEHHGKTQMSSLGEEKGATFVISLPVRRFIPA